VIKKIKASRVSRLPLFAADKICFYASHNSTKLLSFFISFSACLELLLV